MPRGGWVAVGAIVGALVANETQGSLRSTLFLAVAAVVAAIGIASLAGRSRASARAVAATLIGLALVAARLWSIGSPEAPRSLPGGSGPWTALVESVGAPRAAGRPAMRSWPRRCRSCGGR